MKDTGIEVVFWGTDVGDIELQDDIRDVKMHQNFARSMSLEDAMSPENILCYEMNGADLPAPHGAPLRLIAPGWYGIANVKWLKRIEVRDRRFMSLLMGRDYVTIREEEHDGETVWAETSVGRARLKSAPARVAKSEAGYRIEGVAWGAPIDKVEVKIDDGPWQPATIDDSEDGGIRLEGLVARLAVARAGRTHDHVARNRHVGAGPARDGRSLDREEAHLLGEQRPDHPARQHFLRPIAPFAAPGCGRRAGLRGVGGWRAAASVVVSGESNRGADGQAEPFP